MANPILLINGSYHFGDNAGIFQTATYIGYQLILPARMAWLDANAGKVAFIFTTHDVETWSDWKGHRVSINGSEIGRIKDKADATGETERIVIEIKTDEFLNLLGGNANFSLAIELEKQGAMPGLADDFVVTRIATSDNLAVALGWK